MGYRFKFLVFLGVFLVGAFSIITWKAFRVYSESYAETALQSERDILEGRVQSIVAEFERFKSLAAKKENVEARLKVLQLPLLAHVIFEDGRWKAQWFEGVAGMREQGKALANQISFESVPQSRNSWAAIKFRDTSGGYAFTIPVLTGKNVHFFSFFLDDKTVSAIMQRGSLVENIHIVAPLAGDIYSSSRQERASVEHALRAARGKARGMTLSKNGRDIVLYQFHPFLQAYILKVIPKLKVASPPASRFYGLVAFALVLVGIALFAMNALFKALFDRLDTAVTKIRVALGSEHSLNSKRGGDELTAIDEVALQVSVVGFTPPEPKAAAAPMATEAPVPAPIPAPVAVANPVVTALNEALTPVPERALDDGTVRELRSGVINCLGYLNRLKSQFPGESPHFILLEQELRSLRKIVDPASAPQNKPLSFQPSFDPILANYKMESTRRDTETAPNTTAKNSEAVTTETPALTVRRPKREINDFGDI